MLLYSVALQYYIAVQNHYNAKFGALLRKVYSAMNKNGGITIMPSNIMLSVWRHGNLCKFIFHPRLIHKNQSNIGSNIGDNRQ